MKVKLLSAEDCKTHIPVIASAVARAMVYSAGESNIEDILGKLIAGDAQCWCVVDDEDNVLSISVTEVIRYQRKVSLHIITFTGDWELTKHLHPVWEEFAKQAGCDTVVAWCRAGWERKLKSFVTETGRKYEKSYVVMEMNLKENEHGDY